MESRQLPDQSERHEYRVPRYLIAAGQQDGLAQCYDGETARGLLDHDGQGCVEVGGYCTHSMWACSVCAIPTGGQDRTCKTHPAATVFLKSIRERRTDDV